MAQARLRRCVCSKRGRALQHLERFVGGIGAFPHWRGAAAVANVGRWAAWHCHATLLVTRYAQSSTTGKHPSLADL